MSAFVVPSTHIAAIVGSAAYYGERSGHHEWRGIMERTARTLAQANIDSCCARYYGTAFPYTPIPTDAQLDGYFADPLTPGALLKAIDCLEYQSCETGEVWMASPARALLETFRHAAIEAVDGYEDAPWGITADGSNAAAHRHAWQRSAPDNAPRNTECQKSITERSSALTLIVGRDRARLKEAAARLGLDTEENVRRMRRPALVALLTAAVDISPADVIGALSR